MAWRDTARWCGVTLAVAGVATLARPASAQGLEQALAGIRLNSKSTTILAKFGNPNEVVIGDQGIRGGGPGSTGNGTGNGTPGLGDGSGAPGLPGGVPPSMPGGGFGGPPPAMPGGMGMNRGGMMRGGPNASPQVPQPGPSYPGAPQGGFGGPPPDGGGGEFGGSGVGGGYGPFGPLNSTLARQQEVTWVYNRKVNNNLVTYEFLIGPNGNVIQIRATGYKGGTARTKRGIALGTTYKTVVKAYGYPEEHILVGRTLVTSYKNKAHVQFQFLNDRGQANPMDDGNKVISITIATVE